MEKRNEVASEKAEFGRMFQGSEKQMSKKTKQNPTSDKYENNNNESKGEKKGTEAVLSAEKLSRDHSLGYGRSKKHGEGRAADDLARKRRGDARVPCNWQAGGSSVR